MHCCTEMFNTDVMWRMSPPSRQSVAQISKAMDANHALLASTGDGLDESAIACRGDRNR